jgi:hypothetical protein
MTACITPPLLRAGQRLAAGQHPAVVDEVALALDDVLLTSRRCPGFRARFADLGTGLLGAENDVMGPLPEGIGLVIWLGLDGRGRGPVLGGHLVGVGLADPGLRVRLARGDPLEAGHHLSGLVDRVVRRPGRDGCRLWVRTCAQVGAGQHDRADQGGQ